LGKNLNARESLRQIWKSHLFADERELTLTDFRRTLAAWQRMQMRNQLPRTAAGILRLLHFAREAETLASAFYKL
jgi:hypothetical protein